MRFIPTRIHGYLDYGIGALMIVAPWLFNFYRGGAETTVFVALGIAALIYSLCTRYELGVVKAISMPMHLTLDFMSGVLLALSPWLLGFADYVTAPHVVFGMLEIGASLFTQKYPSGFHAHAQAGHD